MHVQFGRLGFSFCLSLILVLITPLSLSYGDEQQLSQELRNLCPPSKLKGTLSRLALWPPRPFKCNTFGLLPNDLFSVFSLITSWLPVNLQTESSFVHMAFSSFVSRKLMPHSHPFPLPLLCLPSPLPTPIFFLSTVYILVNSLPFYVVLILLQVKEWAFP